MSQEDGTFGDCKNEVIFSDAMVVKLKLSNQLKILQSFQRAYQGSVTAGHLTNQ